MGQKAVNKKFVAPEIMDRMPPKLASRYYCAEIVATLRKNLKPSDILVVTYGSLKFTAPQSFHYVFPRPLSSYSTFLQSYYEMASARQAAFLVLGDAGLWRYRQCKPAPLSL